VFAPVWKDVKHVWTRDIFRSVFKSHSSELTQPEDYVNHSLYFEAKTFLHGLLVVEDKISMAHGLETRVPFLDNELVDFAMQVPVALKLNNLQEVIKINENIAGPKPSIYFQKTKDGKKLLREVMQRYVPDSVSGAEKKGFSAPDASWFKGESIDYVRRKLFNDHSRIYEYINSETVKNLLEEHTSGQQNRRLFVWSLLNFDEFLNQFL
jgi:asparagine synthase (glutamine-hydrolysing)